MELYLIFIYILISLCNADDPSLCKTGKYRIIPKSDCVGYYFCLYRKAIEMPPCASGFKFSRSYHVCVPEGSVYDDCVPGDTVIPGSKSVFLLFSLLITFCNIPYPI